MFGWVLLTCIPLSVIGLVVWSTLVRQRSVSAFLDILPALLGVGLIVVGCVVVIAEQRGRRRWWSRIGKACVRCGYDMPSRPQDTCPECGLERAAMQRHQSVLHSMSPGVKRLLAVAFWIAAVIVVIGLYLRSAAT